MYVSLLNKMLSAFKSNIIKIDIYIFLVRETKKKKKMYLIVGGRIKPEW